MKLVLISVYFQVLAGVMASLYISLMCDFHSSRKEANTNWKAVVIASLYVITILSAFLLPVSGNLVSSG